MPDAAELADVFLRITGAFYTFAGVIATRAGMTAHFLDRAIAAISLKPPQPAETARTAWLIASSAVVLAGGLLLLAGLEIAAWVFAASALAQAVYLTYLAPRFFDVADPPDPQGRRQTTNAFYVYAVATAFVIWAASRGWLSPLADTSPYVLAAVAAGLLLYGGWVAKTLWGTPKQPSHGGSGLLDDDYAAETRPPHESLRIKVMCDYQCDPLWGLDDGYGCFSPRDLEISPELAADLEQWAAAYDSSFDADDPAMSRWSEAEIEAHEAEGHRLAVRLQRELPDRVVFAFDRHVGVLEVRAEADGAAPPA